MREVVKVQISSYRGSIGGEHYYGKFIVNTKWEKVLKPDGTVSLTSRSGFGAERHPRDNTDLERKLGAKEAAYLNKKDDGGFFTTSRGLKRGDLTTRFNDTETIIETAKTVFPTLFDDDDILVIEDEHCLHKGVCDVLIGPQEFVDFFGEHRTYSEQQEFLMERGYLIKEETPVG